MTLLDAGGSWTRTLQVQGSLDDGNKPEILGQRRQVQRSLSDEDDEPEILRRRRQGQRP